MHLSYKFGEVAQYSSDTNIYLESEDSKIYYYKEQSKVEIYINNSLTKTIENVKKVGSAGGLCILTNEGKLYFSMFGANGVSDFELDNVVDFVGCKTIFNNNWDISLKNTFLVVFFESGTKLYLPLGYGDTPLMSVAKSFNYGDILTFIPLSDLSVLVSKNSVICMKADGTTYKTFYAQQAPIKTWVDAGYMYYTTNPQEGEINYTAQRLILFFAGNYEYAFGVDLKKLQAEFETKPDGSYLDLEIDDHYTGNAITPVTQRTIEVKSLVESGVYFNDANYRYIKTSYSLQDPPQITSIIVPSGYEVTNAIPYTFSVNAPITKIQFVGSIYTCQLQFITSITSGENYLIFVNTTSTDFSVDSVEIEGKTINRGETVEGFNITGGFSIKLNISGQPPASIQGNFISKDGVTTPFTSIKFVDKDGVETDITNYNFIAKG